MEESWDTSLSVYWDIKTSLLCKHQNYQVNPNFLHTSRPNHHYVTAGAFILLILKIINHPYFPSRKLLIVDYSSFNPKIKLLIKFIYIYSRLRFNQETFWKIESQILFIPIINWMSNTTPLVFQYIHLINYLHVIYWILILRKVNNKSFILLIKGNSDDLSNLILKFKQKYIPILMMDEKQKMIFIKFTAKNASIEINSKRFFRTHAEK